MTDGAASVILTVEIELTEREFELLNIYLADYLFMLSDPEGPHDLTRRELAKMRAIVGKVKNAYLK